MSSRGWDEAGSASHFAGDLGFTTDSALSRRINSSFCSESLLLTRKRGKEKRSVQMEYLQICFESSSFCHSLKFSSRQRLKFDRAKRNHIVPIICFMACATFCWDANGRSLIVWNCHFFQDPPNFFTLRIKIMHNSKI